jgi:signal peptidase II
MSKEKVKTPILQVSYGLILGGAFSNLFDRIWYGYVIDYLDIHIWPVFNLSDTAITVGVGLFLLNSFRMRRDKETRC